VTGEPLAGEQEVDEGLDPARELALAQPVELDGLGAAGEAVLRGGQVEQVGGAGEQEAAGRGVLVDGELERGDQARGALDLVDREQAAGVLCDESVRVGLGCLLGEAVVEGDEQAAALVDDGLRERGLPDLARALDHDDAGVVEGLVDAWGDRAAEPSRRRGHRARVAARGAGSRGDAAVVGRKGS